MRILHFINNINLSWYTMFTDTVRAQQRRGHEVWTVFPPAGINYKRMVDDELPVVPLPVRSSKFDYFAAWKLSRILKKKKIDILHTHLTSSAQLGSAAARWAGIPCVASVLKMTKKRRYMKCDMLLPCSNAVMDDLLEQGAPRDFMRRIYTGIDLQKFMDGFKPGCNARSEFGYGPEHVVLGTVARLVPMKGHDVLLDAMPKIKEKHPEARLLIVGDGELRPDLEKQARDLGVDDVTTFAGTRYDLQNILAAVNVVVMSSKDKEGLPVILVQACLAACPVVMTDVAGIREIISNGETGLLIPPGDPGSLAGAVDYMLNDPVRAAEMAHAARAHVAREFDVNNTAGQMDEVYIRLLTAGKGR